MAYDSNFRSFEYGSLAGASVTIYAIMPDTATVEARELMDLAASLLDRAGSSTDDSERAQLVTNLRFLLNLADDVIVREFSVE
jgi:hypothetical protein